MERWKEVSVRRRVASPVVVFFLAWAAIAAPVWADDVADWNAAMTACKTNPDTLPVSTNLVQIVDSNGNRGSGNPIQLQWWNAPQSPTLTGDYVKVVTWTSYTDSYKQDNQAHTNNWTNPTVFVSAAGELLNYFQINYSVPSTSATNNIRVQKAEGMQTNMLANKFFVEFWVKPSDLYRPTRDTLITTHTADTNWPSPMPTHAVAADAATPDFATFDLYKTNANPNNAGFDYRMSTNYTYPFTGLGYTYDWSRDTNGNTRITGVSEFTLNGYSAWIVSGVYSTDV